MKRVGVFLGYTPNQPITNQGIGRLIGFVVSGAVQSDEVKPVLAFPRWYRANLMELLKDQRIDVDRVELLTTRGVPVLFRFSRDLRPPRPAGAPGRFTRLRQRASAVLQRAAIRTAASSTPWAFLANALWFALVALLISPLFVLRAIKKVLGVVRRWVSRSRFGHRLFRWRQRTTRQLHLADQTVSVELRRLVQRINRRRDITSWLVPSVFWPEIEGIKAPKLVAVPDILFFDFPSQYASPTSLGVYQRIERSVRAADRYVCFCEHVRDNHLVRPLGIDPDKVHIIKHGYIDNSVYLGGEGTMRENALEVLRRYQQTRMKPENPGAGIDFASTRYLFYSSQLRAHKNFGHLLSAYRTIVTEHDPAVKLIVTADLRGDSRLIRSIEEWGLGLDVISMHDVPSPVLAALYHLADVSVTPSLFEGGFPFTFSEAFSVGTPSVMAATPMTSAEIADGRLAARMLFDPYDVRDIVATTSWALRHRDELLALQTPLDSMFRGRSWEVQARQYLDVLVGPMR